MAINLIHVKSAKVKILGMLILVLSLLAVGGPEFGNAKEAGPFPARSIKIIIAASAGGSLGTEIRAISPFLEKYLGTRTVVEYVAGAEGIIGYSKIYNAKPDGYTLIHCTSAAAIATELTRDSARYAVKNMVPIAAWTAKNHSLVVHPDSWKTFPAFLEDGRKRKISIAGVNGAPDIQARLMARSLGMELNMIPFKSSGEGTAAVMGKHVEAAITFTPSAMATVRGGRLRALTIFSPKRDRILPEIPSIVELGYEKVPLVSTAGAFLTAPHTPREIAVILERAVGKAIADPEFIKLAEQNGIVPEFQPAAELRKAIADCYELYNKHRDLIQ